LRNFIRDNNQIRKKKRKSWAKRMIAGDLLVLAVSKVLIQLFQTSVTFSQKHIDTTAKSC